MTLTEHIFSDKNTTSLSQCSSSSRCWEVKRRRAQNHPLRRPFRNSLLFTSALLSVLIVLPYSFAAFAMSGTPISKRPNPSVSTTTNRHTHFLSNTKNNNDHAHSEEKKDDAGVYDQVDDDDHTMDSSRSGKLKKVKEREAALLRLLASVREEKLATLRSKPLTIGVVGFGRFGQFISRSFAKHACRVVVTSRSDYTDVAEGMGVTYVPLSDPKAFLDEELDVIVLAVSILSFEDTVRKLSPHLQDRMHDKRLKNKVGPLIVDVLSVKEHPREILLEQLPSNCDILCTHPMFGPDSGRYSWEGLTFVYERTRIHGAVFDPDRPPPGRDDTSSKKTIISPQPPLEYVEGVERMERFLSVWEEEGCRMVPMSCRDHDEHAANSQFITHLMGRILGTQGLKLQPTPIDTKGFESVLKLVGTTTADSFDLFYGLYKYNRNSMDTIRKLRSSMDDVVEKLQIMEQGEKDPDWMNDGKMRTFSLRNYIENSFPAEPDEDEVTVTDDTAEIATTGHNVTSVIST